MKRQSLEKSLEMFDLRNKRVQIYLQSKSSMLKRFSRPTPLTKYFQTHLKDKRNPLFLVRMGKDTTKLLATALTTFFNVIGTSMKDVEEDFSLTNRHTIQSGLTITPALGAVNKHRISCPSAPDLPEDPPRAGFFGAQRSTKSSSTTCVRFSQTFSKENKKLLSDLDLSSQVSV